MGIGRRVAELWGFCGARRSPWLGRPTGTGHPSPADFRILVTTSQVTQCHWSDLPACRSSAPNADSVRLSHAPLAQAAARRLSILGVLVLTPPCGRSNAALAARDMTAVGCLAAGVAALVATWRGREHRSLRGVPPDGRAPCRDLCAACSFQLRGDVRNECRDYLGRANTDCPAIRRLMRSAATNWTTSSHVTRGYLVRVN